MKEQLRIQELRARSLLHHRFGLLKKSTEIDGESYSVENLEFNSTLAMFKGSFRMFMLEKDSQDKLYNLIAKVLHRNRYRIPEKEILILLHRISNYILNFYNEGYLANLEELLKSRSLIVVPVRTYHKENGDEKDHKEHFTAVALFDDRLLKVNRAGSEKTPTIRIYRTQQFPIDDIKNAIQEYLGSFTQALDLSTWDKSINSITKNEKVNQITKKEQSVGNAAWLTLKMLIIVIVYAIFYEYFKSKGLREFQADPMAMEIAEGYYKLFIVDDRNRAIRDYLEMHHYENNGNLSVLERAKSIKEFLNATSHKHPTADREMLAAIYRKSLNWLLADYLKNGDIGEAHALIEAERNDPTWNPLIYGARFGKVAIAELLGSNEHYVNLPNANLNLPLHYAVINGQVEIVKVLLRYRKKNKIDLSAKNADGNTALHLAILYNHSDIFELLLKSDAVGNGIDSATKELIEVQNNNGETALKLACEHQHISFIKRLLAKGASLDGIVVEDYPEEVQIQLRKAGKASLL